MDELEAVKQQLRVALHEVSLLITRLGGIAYATYSKTR
jgi:hypothetical protein